MGYDRFPVTPVGARADVAVGWDEVAASVGRGDPRQVVVEAYPGVRPADLAELARRLGAAFVDTTRFPADVEAAVAACFDSADFKEGRTAFMEKRPPVFRGV